jgi:hypothetical protein
VHQDEPCEEDEKKELPGTTMHSKGKGIDEDMLKNAPGKGGKRAAFPPGCNEI